MDDWESIAGPGAKAPQRRAVGGLTELTHLVWMGKTVRGDRAKPEDRESEDRGFTEAVGQGTAAGSDGNAGLGSDAGFAAATDGVARSRRRAHVRACQPGPGREAPLCDSECDAAARARAEAARLAPEVTVVSEAWLERLGGRRRQGGREPRRDLPFGADPRVAMDDWAISLVGPRGLEVRHEGR